MADGAVMSFTAGVPTTTTPSTGTAFSDVPASFWAYGAIGSLSKLGYITGYPDGSFKPDGVITRAEFISILTRALKLQAYNLPGHAFGDVSSSDWFYSSVGSAVYAGLASGEGNSSFAPNKPVTREEIAVILVNSLGKQNEARANMGGRTAFTDDANISSWARGSVVVAVKYGLLKGYPDGSFLPINSATRAEASAMIENILGISR
jgi:2',3'-cyclic-nucleotide 2'-phosphodiesterase/3'-nucleotidase/2',3'-cyclic-nucleotide 2'-phosphodiesterase/3'-nucleotidase/5'-nucleotidase